MRGSQQDIYNLHSSSTLGTLVVVRLKVTLSASPSSPNARKKGWCPTVPSFRMSVPFAWQICSKRIQQDYLAVFRAKLEPKSNFITTVSTKIHPAHCRACQRPEANLGCRMTGVVWSEKCGDFGMRARVWEWDCRLGQTNLQTKSRWKVKGSTFHDSHLLC